MFTSVNVMVMMRMPDVMGGYFISLPSQGGSCHHEAGRQLAEYQTQCEYNPEKQPRFHDLNRRLHNLKIII